MVHFALVGRAHRAPRAVDHDRRLGSALAAQLRELAKAGFEDPLERADRVARVDRALVQRLQVVAAPELALERIGLRARAADAERLAEDEHPGKERDGEQQRQHRLYDDGRIDDQRPELEILRERHA
jgi:hypothetical protein